jgi:hypothetical protein
LQPPTKNQFKDAFVSMRVSRRLNETDVQDAKTFCMISRLQAIRETSAGLRQEAGNHPVDVPPALSLKRVGQTASHSLELAPTPFATGAARSPHGPKSPLWVALAIGSTLSLTMASFEIFSSAMLQVDGCWRKSPDLTKDVVSAYG